MGSPRLSKTSGTRSLRRLSPLPHLTQVSGGSPVADRSPTPVVGIVNGRDRTDLNVSHRIVSPVKGWGRTGATPLGLEGARDHPRSQNDLGERCRQVNKQKRDSRGLYDPPSLKHRYPNRRGHSFRRVRRVALPKIETFVTVEKSLRILQMYLNPSPIF